MSTPHWSADQRRFAQALLNPESAVPEFITTRNGTDVAQRFDVYRNNVLSSLIDALLAAFPVTARLVSEDSFRVLAREYLRHELPQHAALHEFGAALPEFLRHFAPAAETPYLPDIAALEHAWWQSYGALDAPALSLRELAAVSGESLLTRRIQLHPAARLVASGHPVHSIWAAHQGGEPSAPAAWTAEFVLITRPEATVAVRAISAADHTMLAALLAGATVEVAAAAALARDPQFDPGTTLLLAVNAGAIQELHT
jgi:hypothetical protein